MELHLQLSLCLNGMHRDNQTFAFRHASSEKRTASSKNFSLKYREINLTNRHWSLPAGSLNLIRIAHDTFLEYVSKDELEIESKKLAVGCW